MDNNKNCYLILHLSTSATREEVKKSYRKLANLYHPDKPTGDAERFRIIKDAYDKLMKAAPVSKPHQNYNNREMPGPEFLYMGITERKGHYVIKLMITNVIKVTADGDNHWDIPHNVAYAKSMQVVTLKLSYDDAKRINYKLRFTLKGTNGKEYDANNEFFIPKPKSKFEKIMDKIW